jgi:glucosyl-3-phosphoglycerate synthase
MSDFHQHGLVPTLPRLCEPDAAAWDRQLAAFSAQRPVALLLPCHGRDLGTPTLARILEILSSLRFPDTLVLALNGAPPAAVGALRAQLRPFPYRTAVLVCDAPAVWEELRKPALAALAPGAIPGKGLNLWLAQGFARVRTGAAAVLAHDTDIISYAAELPLRLAFPLLHPELGYTFAKGYYHRAADRLYGRVTRLFFLPLVETLLRVAGHVPLLDFLAGFRYPLAGEFAADTAAAGLLRCGNGYAMETVQLCDLHRVSDPERVCQVDVGPNYEHRHQPMGDAGAGLGGMAAEIAAALFGELASEGVALGEESAEAVRVSYIRTASAFARRYSHVAMLNGLASDLEAELAAVTQFAAVLPKSAMGARPAALPPWATVDRVAPGMCGRLVEAALAGGDAPGR